MHKVTKNAVLFSFITVVAFIAGLGFNFGLVVLAMGSAAITAILSIISLAKYARDHKSIFWSIFSLVFPAIVYWFGTVYIY